MYKMLRKALIALLRALAAIGVLILLVLFVLASIFLFPGFIVELMELTIGVRFDPLYVLLVEAIEFALYAAGIYFALKLVTRKSL